MKKYNKKSIIIGATSLIIIILILLGLTYAYYKTRIINNPNETSINVKSNKLEIAYVDGEATLNGDKFNGNYNAFEPGDIIVKKFSVENTGNGAASYKVVIENLVNTFTRTEDIEMALTCDVCSGLTGKNYYPIESGDLVTNEIASKEIHNYTLTIIYKHLDNVDQSIDMEKKLNGKINIVDVESKTLSGTIANAEEGDYVIVESTPKRSEIINGKFKVVGLETGTHTIKLYSKDSASPIAQTTFTISNTSKKVTIADRNNVEFIIEDTIIDWENAPSGTLLYAIKRDNPTIYETEDLGTNKAVGTTAVGGASLSTEKIMASTQDDYGNSYYYRGNVDNNFVNYSGMCWRIVRVLGNSDIKLVLADENNECNAAGYSINNQTSSFIGGVTSFIYSNNSDSSTSQNYTTWEVDTLLKKWAGINESRAYEYYINPSTSPTLINSTFTNPVLDISKLAVAGWCNDVSMNSKSISNLDNYVTISFNGDHRQPTLKCDMTGVEDSKSVVVSSNVGILTADEIKFAGNSQYSYLYYNAVGSQWGTLTPKSFGFGSVFLRIFTGYNGSVTFNEYGADYPNKAIRPAVVLSRNVTIKNGGNGTLNAPYEIE